MGSHGAGEMKANGERRAGDGDGLACALPFRPALAGPAEGGAAMGSRGAGEMKEDGEERAGDGMGAR
jgi:hypothetical protein